MRLQRRMAHTEISVSRPVGFASRSADHQQAEKIVMSQDFEKAARMPPISVRLTREEYMEAKAAAGGLSLSAYIRKCLFHGHSVVAQHPSRISPKGRQELLAKILMKLGQLDLDQKLVRISDALNLGVFQNADEIEASLKDIHVEMRALRHDLLSALGLRPKNGGDP